MAYRIIEHTNSEFSTVLDRMILLVDMNAKNLAAEGYEGTSGWDQMAKEFRALKKSRDHRLGIGIAIDENYWDVIDIARADLQEGE